MSLRTRRGLAILLLIVTVALVLGAFLVPAPSSGLFPAGFTEIEKRQIIRAAHHEAWRQAVRTLFQGRFDDARRWALLATRQQVRSVELQGEGRVWVHFEVDGPGGPGSPGTWAQYSLVRMRTRWRIEKP